MRQDRPERCAVAFDLCDGSESYLAVGELLKEEALQQLNANPKEKKKAPPVDTAGKGPEFKAVKGQVLPEATVRLLDAEQALRVVVLAA